MLGPFTICLHAGRTQIDSAAALREFLSKQQRDSRKSARIFNISREYVDLRDRHRGERDTRRGELERDVQDELAAGRRYLQELLQHSDFDEAKRTELLAEYEKTCIMKRKFDIERQIAVLEQEHKQEEDSGLIRAAVEMVHADALVGAASVRAGVADAMDKPGEPQFTGQVAALESETSYSEKLLAEVEAPASADQQHQVGPGQGQPQALAVLGGQPTPARSSACADYFDDGKMVRLRIGDSQFEEWNEHKERWRAEPARKSNMFSTRDPELDPHEVTTAKGFTLPKEPISADEAIAATGELKSDLKSDGFKERGEFMRGAHAALTRETTQRYYADLVRSADQSGRDLEPVRKILDRYEGEWVVVAVCPGREDTGPLGVQEARVWCDGNQMAGPTANYECVVLLGLDERRILPLAELAKPDSGVERLYFLGVNTLICEASNVKEYIPQCCARNMAIGFCLVGDGLREVYPLVLCGRPSDSVLSAWKCTHALGESTSVQLDGKKKKKQFECLIVMLLSLLCGATARGSVRMNAQTASHAVRQGPKMSLRSASWDRRQNVVGGEAQLVTNFAAEVVALAATTLDWTAARRALLAAVVAERVRETYIHVSSLAICFHDKYVAARRASSKSGSNRKREGSDAGGERPDRGDAGEERPDRSALNKVETGEIDLFYRVSDLAWRNQRVLLRVLKIMRETVGRPAEDESD